MLIKIKKGDIMKLLSLVFISFIFSVNAYSKAHCWCHVFFGNKQIGDGPTNGVEFEGDSEKNCHNYVCVKDATYTTFMQSKKNEINIVNECTGKPSGYKIDLKMTATVGGGGAYSSTFATLTCQSTVSCPQGSWADSNFPGKCVSPVPNTDGIKTSGLKDQRLQNNEFFIWQGGLFKVSNTAVPLVSGSWNK